MKRHRGKGEGGHGKEVGHDDNGSEGESGRGEG